MQPTRAYRLTIRAIFIALITIQSVTPFLGFIPLGIINLTIVHLTVIVAALVLGPQDGAVMGLIWGLGTLIRAYIAPRTPLEPLIFTNPVIAILPRILVGYGAGWSYRWFKTQLRSATVAMATAAAVGSIINTSLVLLLMRWLSAGALASFYQVRVTSLNHILMGVVATNGIPELIVALVVVPLVVQAIFKANQFLAH